MKYIKSRQEFLKENFEQIYEYSGSHSTFHNDVSWKDSLLGKLFSSIGKKIRKVNQSGKIGIYLKQLESEFKAGQAKAIEKQTYVQNFRLNDDIITLYKYYIHFSHSTLYLHFGIKWC